MARWNAPKRKRNACRDLTTPCRLPERVRRVRSYRPTPPSMLTTAGGSAVSAPRNMSSRRGFGDRIFRGEFGSETTSAWEQALPVRTCAFSG